MKRTGGEGLQTAKGSTQNLGSDKKNWADM